MQVHPTGQSAFKRLNQSPGAHSPFHIDPEKPDRLSATFERSFRLEGLRHEARIFMGQHGRRLTDLLSISVLLPPSLEQKRWGLS